MGKKTPPQHSVTARIEFISLNSDAWDGERWTEDIEALVVAGEDPNDHAIRRYFAGLSRGDLDAPDSQGNTARSYLRKGDPVEVFALRRLRATKTARLRDQGGRLAQLAALASALESTPEQEFGRPLAESQLDAFVDRYGLDLACEIGEFALLCSEAPRPGESKRSGS